MSGRGVVLDAGAFIALERRDPIVVHLAQRFAREGVRGFATAPTAPLSVTCRTRAAPLDFDLDVLATEIFGASALWDGAPLHAVLGPDAERRLADVRRAIHRPPFAR